MSLWALEPWSLGTFEIWSLDVWVLIHRNLRPFFLHGFHTVDSEPCDPVNPSHLHSSRKLYLFTHDVMSLRCLECFWPLLEFFPCWFEFSQWICNLRTYYVIILKKYVSTFDIFTHLEGLVVTFPSQCMGLPTSFLFFLLTNPKKALI